MAFLKTRHFFSQHSVLLLGILFFVVVGVVYFPALFAGFLSDDYDFVYNTMRQSGVWHYFSTNYLGSRQGGAYAPFLNLWYTVAVFFFGRHPFPYHLLSVILHLAVSSTVFALFFVLTKKKEPSFFAALLFGVLPAHSEAVSWIAAVPHLLGTLGYMVGIMCYFLFFQSGKKRYYIFSLLSIIFSLLVKEIAITFLAVFFLIEAIFRQWTVNTFFVQCKNILLRFLAPLGIIGAYLAVRQYATGVLFGYYGQAELSFDLLQYGRQGIALALSLFLDFPLRGRLYAIFMDHILFVLPIAACILFVLFFFCFVRKKCAWRGFVFLGFSYILVSLPFLNLLLNPRNNEGERYTYLPSVFAVSVFVLFCTVLFEKISKHGRVIGRIVFSVLAILGGYILFQKNIVWKRAGEMAAGITSQYQALGIEENDAVFFVGLPDSLGGAQVFRNAIREAIAINAGRERPKGERIPMYTFFPEESSPGEYVAARQCDPHAIVLSPKENSQERMFTGFPTYANEFLTAALHEFQKSNHTGTSISVIFSEDAVQAFQKTGNHIFLVYYTGEQLMAFRIE